MVSDVVNGPRSFFHARMFVLALSLTLASLIAFSACRNSPTFDEPAHFASGWSHWELGRFNLYCVNPPLVRMVSAVPSRVIGLRLPISALAPPGARPEFGAGRAAFRDDPAQSLWALTIARWACLPFALLGVWVCYRWSMDLYGSRAGLVAATLWCFSPTVLAHAQLITPDVGAASLGAAAAYLLWLWLRTPDWGHAGGAGIVLGLAMLTKATLLFLLPLWPLMWIAYRRPRRDTLSRDGWQLSGMLLVALFVVHAGFGFEGSFKPLKDYQFVSRSLGGSEQFFDITTTGNRFSDSWLGVIPVPLPQYYVAGMDVQRRDFEERKWSYLRGEWRWGGWWYYYLYALVIKEPLGLWAITGLALMTHPLAKWRDELVLICPMLVILGLVSSQTGFNHHYRYVLPALPFLFILVSRVAAKPTTDVTGSYSFLRRSLLVFALLVWFVLSSLFAYPHSLSYFNELAGGPLGGPKHLLGSSTDWGQDLFYVREWLDKHPEIDDFSLAWTAHLIEPRWVNINAPRPPSLVECQADLYHGGSQIGHEKQWHFVSVNELHHGHDQFAYFRDLKPTTMIAYTIYGYHVTRDEICGSVVTSERP